MDVLSSSGELLVGSLGRPRLGVPEAAAAWTCQEAGPLGTIPAVAIQEAVPTAVKRSEAALLWFTMFHVALECHSGRLLVLTNGLENRFIKGHDAWKSLLFATRNCNIRSMRRLVE